jgi:3-oxoacyl-[acyl-carrier protein] reductase
MRHIEPGTVILITGATGGIGFEIASQAAASGAIVGVHGSRAERVADAIERLKGQTPEAKLIGMHGDFREAGVIESVVERVASEAGQLDAVIHCAITGAPGTQGLFAQMDPQAFGLNAAHVLGIFQQLAFAALPHLSKQGGTIISFASDAGRFASARQSVLGASFGGIMMFVRNLALEVARNGVRVHCISPSYVVDTPVFERYARAAGERGIRAQERAGLGLPSPKDIAPMALFLCGPDAAKITGQVISVNGGLNA